VTGQPRDRRGAAALSLVLAALAGAVVIYGFHRMAGDCWAASFPSAGYFRGLAAVGLVSAAVAMALGWAVGPRTRSSGAQAASVFGFAIGALSALGALGLLLIAQSFPLCVD
jgi:hypothetical protein